MPHPRMIATSAAMNAPMYRLPPASEISEVETLVPSPVSANEQTISPAAEHVQTMEVAPSAPLASALSTVLSVGRVSLRKHATMRMDKMENTHDFIALYPRMIIATRMIMGITKMPRSRMTWPILGSWSAGRPRRLRLTAMASATMMSEK